MMFSRALILMLLVEAVSLLAFVYTGVALPLLILIGLTVFVLSLKNLSWGVYALFGELFVGSRGRLLEHGVVSLRMVIFVAVLLAWILKVISSKVQITQKIQMRSIKYWMLYILLLTVLGWGTAWGLVRNNGLSNVFNDANGYLYLLIVPVVLTVVNSKDQIKNLLDILGAAVVVIALKTLVLFTWFTGSFAGVATVYQWVIDSRAGEITGFAGSASRIFLASQFYSLLAVFIWGTKALVQKLARREWWIFAAALFGVVMSLSRSFWLGGLFAAVFVILILFYQRLSVMKILKIAGTVLLILAVEAAGVFLIVNFIGEGFSETVVSRTQNPLEEAAGSARLLLLPELLTEIGEAPLLGKGFGEEVTYKSFLPDRISRENPDGEITSFAFEWGYLDMMLKFGLLGWLIYLFWIGNIFELGWRMPQTLGLLAGLVALVTLNITTPYLNHPLGIGYLAFLSSYFLYGKA